MAQAVVRPYFNPDVYYRGNFFTSYLRAFMGIRTQMQDEYRKYVYASMSPQQRQKTKKALQDREKFLMEQISKKKSEYYRYAGHAAKDANDAVDQAKSSSAKLKAAREKEEAKEDDLKIQEGKAWDNAGTKANAAQVGIFSDATAEKISDKVIGKVYGASKRGAPNPSSNLDTVKEHLMKQNRIYKQDPVSLEDIFMEYATNEVTNQLKNKGLNLTPEQYEEIAKDVLNKHGAFGQKGRNAAEGVEDRTQTMFQNILYKEPTASKKARKKVSRTEEQPSGIVYDYEAAGELAEGRYDDIKSSIEKEYKELEDELKKVQMKLDTWEETTDEESDYYYAPEQELGVFGPLDSPRLREGSRPRQISGEMPSFELDIMNAGLFDSEPRTPPRQKLEDIVEEIQPTEQEQDDAEQIILEAAEPPKQKDDAESKEQIDKDEENDAQTEEVEISRITPESEPVPEAEEKEVQAISEPPSAIQDEEKMEEEKEIPFLRKWDPDGLMERINAPTREGNEAAAVDALTEELVKATAPTEMESRELKLPPEPIETTELEIIESRAQVPPLEKMEPPQQIEQRDFKFKKNKDRKTYTAQEIKDIATFLGEDPPEDVFDEKYLKDLRNKAKDNYQFLASEDVATQKSPARKSTRSNLEALDEFIQQEDGFNVEDDTDPLKSKFISVTYLRSDTNE